MENSNALAGLPQILIDQGFLSEDQAYETLTESNKSGTSFMAQLVQNGTHESARLAEFTARTFGVPVIDLAHFDLSALPADAVPKKFVGKHRVAPLATKDTKLYLGISDPFNLEVIDEVKFSTNLTVEPILVEADKLEKIVEAILEDSEDDFNELLSEDFDNIMGEDVGETGLLDEDAEESDAPVVRFVNKTLLEAINKGASDLHFEPYEKSFRVRLRIDGVLQDLTHPPKSMAGQIVARIKVMSQIDTSERRVPQDGRIKLKISKGKAIDFRVNTCPTLYGEKVVLRVLDSSSANLGIDVLGYEPEQKERYLEALAQPYGMILVTGPTGSGKTVSLYTGLNILNTEDRNISTAEDPAEIVVPGINQVNVNPKVGLTFAEALKAFLRQDPDVIMVGEIRDLETGEIAIKAAQTGHLVLSTLHTNDAPQTLTRMVNMGIPAYNIANAVSLIIAQRLARRLCNECKQVDDVPAAVLDEYEIPEAARERLTIYKPNHAGCSNCTAGYKGRVGIYQVMPMTEEMGRIIMDGGNSIDIADQAQKDGISDIRQSGIKKVTDGIIGLEELDRVTKE